MSILKISNLKEFKIQDYKPNFLLDEQILLKNFGIKSHLMLTKVKYYFKTDKLSAYWQSIVYDQKDILKFYKYIGFNDSEKNKRLKDCVNIIKMHEIKIKKMCRCRALNNLGRHVQCPGGCRKYIIKLITWKIIMRYFYI